VVNVLGRQANTAISRICLGMMRVNTGRVVIMGISKDVDSDIEKSRGISIRRKRTQG
jgi:hypothetical protein